MKFARLATDLVARRGGRAQTNLFDFVYTDDVYRIFIKDQGTSVNVYDIRFKNILDVNHLKVDYYKRSRAAEDHFRRLLVLDELASL
jgi:hypothetical protein